MMKISGCYFQFWFSEKLIIKFSLYCKNSISKTLYSASQANPHPTDVIFFPTTLTFYRGSTVVNLYPQSITHSANTLLNFNGSADRKLCYVDDVSIVYPWLLKQILSKTIYRPHKNIFELLDVKVLPFYSCLLSYKQKYWPRQLFSIIVIVML